MSVQTGSWALTAFESMLWHWALACQRCMAFKNRSKREV